MSNTWYWRIKLEKIQFALEMVQRVKTGANVDTMLESLKRKESDCSARLIEELGKKES